MRILILANKDLASNLALNLLLKSTHQHRVSILLSSKVGNATKILPSLADLAFFEQGLFNDIISPLSITNAHTSNAYLESFERMQQKGIDIAPVAQINHPDNLRKIMQMAPDLIISIRFGQILQQGVIEIPTFGVINLHSGLLPNYRGVMASFWAMLNNDTEIGTTLHYIDSKQIDAGDIISSASRPIDYTKSYLHNVLSLYPQGIQQVVDTIKQLTLGKPVQSTPMALEQGQYYRFPDEHALRMFTQRGLRLFDYAEVIEFSKWYYQAKQ